MTETITITLFTDDEGNALLPSDPTYGDIETMVTLPAKYEVCSRCKGRGVHDHPSFNGLTAEDFAEDPDLRENYFAGVYDVACERCGGLRVELVPDITRMTHEESADYNAWFDQRAEERRLERVERRLLAAGW